MFPFPPNTPVLGPPPGVRSNFDDPHSKRAVFFVVSTILLAFMIIAFAVRITARVFILKRLSWDDLTCTIAALGTICYYINFCFACTGGKIGTHSWDVRISHLSTKAFLIPAYFLDAWATPIWLFTKLTFLLLYLELFRPMRWLRYCIYATIAAVVSFHTAFTILQLYNTTPRPGQTWQQNFLQPRYIIGELNVSVPVTAGGFAFDVIIFMLPIAGVSRLHLSPRRKLGVIGIFAVGSIAWIASTITLIYKTVLDQNRDDFLWGSFDVALTAFVEMCVGVTTTCLPSLSVLARHPRVKSMWSSVSSRTPSKISSGSHHQQKTFQEHEAKLELPRTPYTPIKDPEALHLEDGTSSSSYSVTAYKLDHNPAV